MGEFVIKMPDIGEGVAEAELVDWFVKPGDPVVEDMVLAAVMTDKATVEIPSSVIGTVLWLGAEVGDTVAVGAPLLRIEVGGEAAEAEETTEAESETLAASPAVALAAAHEQAPKPLASPAVRLRAKEAGIDLHLVRGTGPSGAITHEDIDLFVGRGVQPTSKATDLVGKTNVEEIRLTGLRRRIAEKMTLATSRIPHITYVEEIDVSDLEDLRATMNGDRRSDQPKLTILPFLIQALVKAIEEHPVVNATFDDEGGVITRHGAVHIGIAAQTPAGLMVPVLRNAEARDIWACATELNRLVEAARTGTAQREELTGSTITVTSLGALGGVVTTPIINHPEVAIIGVNKIMMRPVWDGNRFIPRKMMNLSSSFDHRVVDGWDAASFIQRVKALLETPSLISIE
ncbi:dihydrolipoamide acetyltransferase family protein [Rhizobium tubonense]|uniref:Dihydrolipoamide acetyltransferase component of pyruvate dehydrogenase complex n=1 Tax=Rhizobium tubonense TaxID=484088 RepID=A0A2W4CP68_9HYPH|nr:dihydrolipoamide acetyltransferase family protein [Rhizobium tubonense]PZM14502.1 branched-chain alpha-keto acid dehydrogenase subunit E2 [Rhizobium tubonense]